MRAKMSRSIKDPGVEGSVTCKGMEEIKGTFFKDVLVARIPFMGLQNTKDLTSLTITFTITFRSSDPMPVAALCSRVKVIVYLDCHSIVTRS